MGNPGEGAVGSCGEFGVFGGAFAAWSGVSEGRV